MPVWLTAVEGQEGIYYWYVYCASYVILLVYVHGRPKFKKNNLYMYLYKCFVLIFM